MVPVWQQVIPAVEGCDGNYANDGSHAVEDECSVCDSDSSNNCVEDCNGDWGGTALEDNCGICDADSSNDCVEDCNGDWGGVAFIDNCGACVAAGDTSCVEGCDGNYANDGSHAVDDECGICGGDNSTCSEEKSLQR